MRRAFQSRLSDPETDFILSDTWWHFAKSRERIMKNRRGLWVKIIESYGEEKLRAARAAFYKKKRP